MTSLDLKTAALCWLRFGRQLEYVATEVGNYSADVFGATDKATYEIETKVSKYDLRNDFKKSKHKNYNHEGTRWGHWVPTYFYFCVPEYLVEEAKSLVETNNSKYGILQYTDGPPTFKQHERLSVAKRAGKIHTQQTNEQVFRYLALRMGSDLCNLYIHKQADSEMWKAVIEQSKALAKTPDLDAIEPEVTEITLGDE